MRISRQGWRGKARIIASRYATPPAGPPDSACAAAVLGTGFVPNTLIQCRVGAAQMVGDHEMLAARACYVDAFDMHQTHQLAYRLWHAAAGLVTRTPALGDPNCR